jgi:hypothetical protein
MPAEPVSADTVNAPVAPKFTDAIANAPVPLLPGMWMTPSLVSVATNATTSGMGVVEAENKRSFTPVVTAAATALVQAKENAIDVGAIGLFGVTEITKLCAAPAAISTGVFTDPATAFVVW